MIFNYETKKKLKEKGFEIICPEENIWILEKGEASVTVAGDDNLIEAIWQDFDSGFDDLSSPDIDVILEWAENMLGF